MKKNVEQVNYIINLLSEFILKNLKNHFVLMEKSVVF